MVATLSTIFYIILFLGVLILILKKSRVGCLFIILSLILFNIFVPDGYDTGIKNENKVKDNKEVSNKPNDLQIGPILNGTYNESNDIDKNNYNYYHNDSNEAEKYLYKIEEDYEDYNENNYLEYDIQYNCVRIGAVCNDGTISNATGRGACSHHGGVAYWLCE
ncbi:MAG: hypothetical protein Q8K02_15970 [Flavobacterium sp.]|nr:hypothetical protein [Flavobacterium sp.]